MANPRGVRPSTGSDRSWQGNVLCRYFMADSCRAGARCPFSHDRSLSNRGTLPCKYFSQGTCAFGNNCRFSHSMASNEITPTATSRTTIGRQEISPSLYLSYPSPESSDLENSIGLDTSWAEAPIFVPRKKASDPRSTLGTSSQSKSWAQVAELTEKDDKNKSWAFVVNPAAFSEISIADAESQLCPFFMVGECRYNEHCAGIHGDLCELCGKAMLHPTHETQRKAHTQSCMSQFEEDMEMAFAIARSKDKTCGICMEVVIEKPKSEARFGIMPSCNHCFCLSCLRKWRQAKQFENKIIRACPECRQTSDYVCPSRFWVDTKEEKAKLLADYKDALTKKECKYYNRGNGECPFGNKCFYRHLSAEGVDVDVGPPSRRSRRQNADGEIESPRTILLYNFLEERDGRIFLPVELNYLLDFLSDSDDADW